MTLASDAVTIRVMEEAASLMYLGWVNRRDVDPEVADGLLQLARNYDQQAAQLRSESESAYA